MSVENPLWGAPRIHGELLKLGFQVAQSTVAKYMVKGQGRPPGQSWWTFLRNHTRDRGDGPFRRADACLQLALWFHHRSARPPRARLDWRDEQSDGRMDCTPDHRSFSLGVQHRDTSSATEIAFLAQSYDSASGPWAFETNLSHLARHGRTDLPND